MGVWLFLAWDTAVPDPGVCLIMFWEYLCPLVLEYAYSLSGSKHFPGPGICVFLVGVYSYSWSGSAPVPALGVYLLLER